MRHEREDFFFVLIAKWRDNKGAPHFSVVKSGHLNKTATRRGNKNEHTG